MSTREREIEFQRNKAEKATATVYQFHYAMKDAGWHPGRTDDNLCDIIRAKGKELDALRAEVEAQANAIQAALDTNGGPIYGADTVDGHAYVMVRHDAFDALAAQAEKLAGGADA